LLSLAGLYNMLPFQKRLMGKEEILRVYLLLNKESGLVAVFNTASAKWLETGGYYYLHRDVPIYYIEHIGLKQDLRPYVSHIICSTDAQEIHGFTVVHRMETLEIRRQTNPPAQYEMLDVDYKNPRQDGIDGKYIPTVRKPI
jgi:GPI mannosyltransferase 3